MIYLLLLLSFTNLYCAEITSVKFIEPVKENTALKSLDQTVKADKAALVLSTVSLFKSIFVGTPGKPAYGISNGVLADYPKINEWVEWQLSGDKKKLENKYNELLTNKSRTSKAERATLEHIINHKLTNTIATVAYGSQQEAQQCLQQLSVQRSLNQTSSSLFEERYATNIYTSRFNIEPQLDMVTTHVTVPKDYNLEAIKEFTADIRPENYKSFDAFLKASSQRLTLLKQSKIFDAMVYQRQYGNRDLLLETAQVVSDYSRTYLNELGFEQFIELGANLTAVSMQVVDPRNYVSAVKLIMGQNPELAAKLQRVLVSNPKKFTDALSKFYVSCADDWQKAARSIKKKVEIVNKLTKEIQEDWNE